MTMTSSVWEATRTFFPLFLDLLQTRQHTSVCVVGASDGKYVLPLARRGIDVIAIERDRLALDGGPVALPGPINSDMPGLRHRLADEHLTHLVRILEADLFDLSDTTEPVDAVWTSCSWHYRINHTRPLPDFITAMTRLCRPGGLLGAEYMMPVQPHQFPLEHYPQEGAVRRLLHGWAVDWETYTQPFVEAPHVEQLTAHIHRMGLIIATRPEEAG